MSLRLVSAALLAASLAACASAGPEATASANASATGETVAANANDPNRVICRRETVVGSNRREKVCLTAKAWADITEEARRKLEQDQARGGNDSIPLGSPK